MIQGSGGVCLCVGQSATGDGAPCIFDLSLASRRHLTLSWHWPHMGQRLFPSHSANTCPDRAYLPSPYHVPSPAIHLDTKPQLIINSKQLKLPFNSDWFTLVDTCLLLQMSTTKRLSKLVILLFKQPSSSSTQKNSSTHTSRFSSSRFFLRANIQLEPCP